MEAHVVVVGGGLAGCTAAMIAATHGASVTLIEKTDDLAGNSAKATSGVNGWGTKAQAALNILEPNGALFEKDTLASGKSATATIVPRLVQTLSVHSTRMVHWLAEETGLDLSAVCQLGGHSHPRTHRCPDTPDGKPVPVGATIMKKLREKIETVEPYKSKVTVMKNTAMVRLLMEEKNTLAGGVIRQVCGVTCSTQTLTYKDDSTAAGAVSNKNPSFDLPATSVVLCTGGYSHDLSSSAASLLNEFAPHLTQLPTTNGPFATGDGVKVCREIGATLRDMDQIQLHPTGLINPQAPGDRTKFLGPEALRGCGGILLNNKGKRFTNELGLRSAVTADIQRQNFVFPNSDGQKAAFVLLSQTCVKAFSPAAVNFYQKMGLFFAAKDLTEVAAFIGCCEPNVAETLDDYEKARLQGKCPATQKVVFPSPVLKADGPFVIAVVTPVVHYTMGGVVITPEAQVTTHSSRCTTAMDPKAPRNLISRINGKLEELFVESAYIGQVPVPGLYAAGEVSTGVHGGNRLGGNSLLECIVFGMISGVNAAATFSDSSGTPLREREGALRTVTLRARSELLACHGQVLTLNLPNLSSPFPEVFFPEKVDGFPGKAVDTRTELQLFRATLCKDKKEGESSRATANAIVTNCSEDVGKICLYFDSHDVNHWMCQLQSGQSLHVSLTPCFMTCKGIHAESVNSAPKRLTFIFDGSEQKSSSLNGAGSDAASMLIGAAIATLQHHAGVEMMEGFHDFRCLVLRSREENEPSFIESALMEFLDMLKVLMSAEPSSMTVQQVFLAPHEMISRRDTDEDVFLFGLSAIWLQETSGRLTKESSGLTTAVCVL